MSYRQLEKKSDSKLDSIEINEENIADFLKTARKYDVDIALKTDRSTEPNTYHVFFSAGKTKDFKRAFTEYVAKSVKAKKRGGFSRGELKREAIKKSPHKTLTKRLTRSCGYSFPLEYLCLLWYAPQCLFGLVWNAKQVRQ